MSYRLTPLWPDAWDRDCARHLLNRAGFGVPHDWIETLAELGPEKAVDALVDYESVKADTTPAEFVNAEDYAAFRKSIQDTDDEEEKRKLRREMQRRERRMVAGLKTWWLKRMMYGQRPLEEKMTLFWHGHFATSAQKVQSSALNFQLNDLFRRQATGNFRDLVTGV
jgi:uncharacterized protein (DUF1800 family)